LVTSSGSQGVIVRDRRKVAVVVGTRPEAIKLSPLIHRLMASDWARPVVIATGQHLELLHQALGAFDVAVDEDLALMTEGQTLSSLTAKAFERLDPYLRAERPEIVLAQGDTTSVMVAATCCFYQRIPFGHVEAGLRTHDLTAPFPEEFNRRVAGLVADLHFAPTEISAQNLRDEGVNPQTVHMTGNTVIDALHFMHARRPPLPLALREGSRVILMTAHRRENFGAPMRGLFALVRKVVDRYPDVEVVYPVHPNPNVKGLAGEMMGGHPRIHLCEPLDYPGLVAVMGRAYLVLTDSGGLQEEAPALGKPVLVTRDQTERPEAVSLGVARLVGTDPAVVGPALTALLDDAEAYRAMARGVSPYGDGKACERICDILAGFLDARKRVTAAV
jgi:UDP-N-acetylglucosamine 2-epimerase (non-hydrolysing)